MVKDNFWKDNDSIFEKNYFFYLGDEDVDYDKKSRYVLGPTSIILKKTLSKN